MSAVRSQRRVRVWIVREGFLEEKYVSGALNDKYFWVRGGLPGSRNSRC